MEFLKQYFNFHLNRKIQTIDCKIEEQKGHFENNQLLPPLIQIRPEFALTRYFLSNMVSVYILTLCWLKSFTLVAKFCISNDLDRMI